MTMFEHTVLGWAVSLFLWYAFIQRHFYTTKNIHDITDEVDEWLNK